MPDRAKTEAVLLLGGDDWYCAKGMIKVDVGKPVEADSKSTAEAFAKKFGGRASPVPSTVDGQPAFRVQVPPHGISLSPREAIVVFRNGRVFLMMAGAVGQTDVSSALEQVRTTWKWTE